MKRPSFPGIRLSGPPPCPLRKGVGAIRQDVSYHLPHIGEQHGEALVRCPVCEGTGDKPEPPEQELRRLS